MRFDVADDGHAIEVRAEEADFDDLDSTGTDYEMFRRRHRARFCGAEGRVSVVGLVDDDRQTFGRGKNIPLVVTARTRSDFLRKRERWETIFRVFGCVFLWLGLSTLSFRALAGLAWLGPFHDDSTVVVAIVASAGCGSVPLALFWAVYAYNSLVAYKKRAENAWRLIDIDLRNRYDLVPQLVTVIREAARHEEELTKRIVALRSLYVGGDIEEKVKIEGDASRTILRVIGPREAYPELTTNALFRQLSDTLTALENKIAHTREFYNDNVNEYRDLTQTFPSSIVARMGGFEPLPLFEINAD